MKWKARRFEVRLPWEVEDGVDAELTVSGIVSEYRPAVMYLRNGDPGYPEEGGEIEDIEIKNEQGCPLPEDIVDRLANDSDFMEAVSAAIEPDDGLDYDAINDAKRDRECEERSWASQRVDD